MKIGFVVNDITQLGGVERVVAILSTCFAEKAGHEVTIFSCLSRQDNEEKYFDFSVKGISIIHLAKDIAPDSWIFKNPFSKPTFLKYLILKKIKSYLTNNPLEIIISTSCWSNCFLPFFSNGAKVVACDHGAFNFIPWIYRCISRICYPFADAVVSLTARNLKNYTFIKEDKKYIIPNMQSFFSDTVSLCENKTLITVTRFSYQKGVDTQLHIAARLKEQLPDWRMDIYGAGEDEEKLLALRKKLDLEDFVHFYPPTTEIKEKLCNAGIYILSSRFEGLPMVLLEAQICGLPSVAFDCDCGPADIISDGEDGYLIPQNDIDAFANAVVKLAKNDKLRKAFGKQAKKNSERFAPEKILQMWQTLFTKLVEKNNAE